MSEDGWCRRWVALNARYRATDSLRRVRAPVLWFLGDRDHNVPTEASVLALQATAMEAKHPDFRIVRLPDAGHGFTATTTGNNRDLGTDTHMAPGYWDAMDAWLRERGFAD
jgi:dienelactone hydrolase